MRDEDKRDNQPVSILTLSPNSMWGFLRCNKIKQTKTKQTQKLSNNDFHVSYHGYSRIIRAFKAYWSALVISVILVCQNIPDHYINLINLLSKRLVGQDSSIPYDDAGLTVQTVTQERYNITMWYMSTPVHSCSAAEVLLDCLFFTK